MKSLNNQKNTLIYSDTSQCYFNPIAAKFHDMGTAELLKKLPMICQTPEHLRIAKDGELVTADSFFDFNFGKINFDRVYEYYEDGYTVIAQGLQDTMGSIKDDFLRTLSQSEKFKKIQMNAYLTPAGENGFPIHWDLHEAYLIQVEGEKSWRLWNAIDEKPFFSADVLGCQTLLEDIERYTTPHSQLKLRAGEVLHIPRGTLHKGIASGAPSMHITVGCRPLTVLDALRERYSSAVEYEGLKEMLLFHMNRNSYFGDPTYLENLNFLVSEFERIYGKA